MAYSGPELARPLVDSLGIGAVVTWPLKPSVRRPNYEYLACRWRELVCYRRSSLSANSYFLSTYAFV
jgi:hypothetical protein